MSNKWEHTFVDGCSKCEASYKAYQGFCKDGTIHTKKHRANRGGNHRGGKGRDGDVAHHGDNDKITAFQEFLNIPYSYVEE